jgi:hypothetical protein
MRGRKSVFAIGIAVMIGLVAFGCARPGPGSAKSTDELLTQLQEDRTELDKTSDTMMKRIDMFNASRKPGERTLQFSEIFMQDLSAEQRDILDTMVQQEKDVSYKTLLQQIISDRDTIQGLQEKVMHLEQSLPDKFVVAKRGDKHQKLAMAYLTTEAQLDEAKAKELLKQVDQTDELVPGNQVWFFYDPGRDSFRTYVTRGTAGQTPIVVRRARQRELVKERDTFKSERDTAQADAASLQLAKTQLEDELVLKQNSLFYHAASSQNLKEQGILSPVLRRLNNVKGLNYDESLDLRQETSITLFPQSFSLEEIHAVRVLPPIFQEGRDFSVETAEDFKSARVVILDPEVFRGKQVVLAVGG